MLKVYNKCCQNCLLSEDRIVSDERATNVIKDCIQRQTHFICHKAGNSDICCSAFYHKYGNGSQMIRIAKRLNAVDFVEHENNDKLIPYKKIKE